MFIMNIPNVEPQQAIVVAESVSSSAKKSGQYYVTAGVCKVVLASKDDVAPQNLSVDNLPSDYWISPEGETRQAFYLKDPGVADTLRGGQIDPSTPDLGVFDYRFGDVSIRVLESPKHGTLGPNGTYYVPSGGFIGTDRFVLEGTLKNRKVKLIYYVKVLNSNAYDKISDDLVAQSRLKSSYCPNDTEWLFPLDSKKGKISLPETTLDPARLQTLLSATHLDSSVTVDIADLPASTLAQTTGTTITLDPTAAGHGWYIDYTPYLNDEYLPTSNPNHGSQ